MVGGGIVGCTLACRLAQDLAPQTSSSRSGSSQPGDDDHSESNASQQRRRRQRPAVGLIETRPPPSLSSAMGRDGPDPRVYSLAPSSVKVLKEVGVWDDGVGVWRGEAEGSGALKGRSQPFEGMQVNNAYLWGGGD